MERPSSGPCLHSLYHPQRWTWYVIVGPGNRGGCSSSKFIARETIHACPHMLSADVLMLRPVCLCQSSKFAGRGCACAPMLLQGCCRSSCCSSFAKGNWKCGCVRCIPRQLKVCRFHNTQNPMCIIHFDVCHVWRSRTYGAPLLKSCLAQLPTPEVRCGVCAGQGQLI